jgi:hypothetical protein
MLPFPGRGWTNTNTYRCHPAEGVWVRVEFGLASRPARRVYLSFWPHKEIAGVRPLMGPSAVEEDVILITALIHDYVNNHVAADRRFQL